MEYSKIKDLLDLYFKGNTTLDQETSLRAYFYSEDVDDRLEPYTVLFNTFEKAAQDVFEGSLLISKKTRFNQKWWLKLAAVMISIIGVAGFMYSANSKAIQEREALAALKQSKDAMYLMASQFNKATQRLSLVDQFQETKNKYLK
ncbi:MAG: hypothetical protein HOC64_08295 [Bacteroidetes bacterium]|nr:hypothetical protein [Bacteroidota bacterium]